MKRILFLGAFAAVLIAGREVLRERYYDATDDENEPVDDYDSCSNCFQYVDMQWRISDAWRQTHLCSDCYVYWLLDRRVDG